MARRVGEQSRGHQAVAADKMATSRDFSGLPVMEITGLSPSKQHQDDAFYEQAVEHCVGSRKED